MRLKIVGGLIVVMSLILAILLFVEEEENVRVIISPKIYSIVKSSENETINITILVNETTSYYFNEDYISNISLSSNTEEVIPLILTEINKSNEYYLYEEEMYYFATIKIKVGFDSDDYLINFEKAYLDISYSNSEVIKLYIGEFNYLFDYEINTDFSINNLMSTHGLVNGIDTSTGLFLNLGNISDNNIIIKKVEIGSKDVVANNFYLAEVFEELTIDGIPKEILNIEDYDYKQYTEYDLNTILLRKDNEIMVYVPFSYIGDIDYLNRFYVKVIYESDDTLKEFVIDDFPYINTSNYKVELEEDYVYYEFEN